MNALISPSTSPTPESIAHDIPSPSKQERLTALQEALTHQRDHEINQLLHAIRRDPDATMAGLVGEVYFEANEHQQLAMDIWSEHLSSEQRFTFVNRKEDARIMEFSKLLTIALDRKYDRLLEVLLKGARELDHPRLLQLVALHHPDASEAQKATTDAWNIQQKKVLPVAPCLPVEKLIVNSTVPQHLDLRSSLERGSNIAPEYFFTPDISSSNPDSIPSEKEMERRLAVCWKLPNPNEEQRGIMRKVAQQVSQDCAQLVQAMKQTGRSLCETSRLAMDEPSELPFWLGPPKMTSLLRVPDGTGLTVHVSNTNVKEAIRFSLSVEVNKYAPSFGNTALTLAIAKGWGHVSVNIGRRDSDRTQKDIIRALLAREDIDVNAPEVSNLWTPLHIACMRADVEVVDALIKRGAVEKPSLAGHLPSDFLTFPYDTARKLVESLLDKFKFGKAPYQEHESEVATLPLREEFPALQEKVMKLFASKDA